MAETRKQRERPLGEWIAGAIGLLLSLGILGYIGWQALTVPEEVPPLLLVQADGVSSSGSGYLVQFTARNRSPTTASTVQVEGSLNRGGSRAATATTTLDYVPGYSERSGGLYFEQDPRTHELKLRATGYVQP
jgi:uncharacterized protein (TIGR02588 family)